MTMSIDGTPSSGQDDDTGAATASSDRDRRAEQAGAQQASTTDARGQQRPESLTREEYADAMRESGPPIHGSRDGHQAADDGEPGGQADLGAGRADGRDGTGGPPADGETDAAASAVTHFHGEFKGRPLDLYTDGTRWASADRPAERIPSAKRLTYLTARLLARSSSIALAMTLPGWKGSGENCTGKATTRWTAWKRTPILSMMSSRIRRQAAMRSLRRMARISRRHSIPG